MLKTLGIPLFLIIIGLGMLPFMLFIGIPIAGIGIIWLIIAVVYEGNKKNVKNT